MIGNFNFPYVNWSAFTLRSGAFISAADKDAVKPQFQFMGEIFLSQLMFIPTRVNKNILDLVLSNYTKISSILQWKKNSSFRL